MPRVTLACEWHAISGMLSRLGRRLRALFTFVVPEALNVPKTGLTEVEQSG